MQKKRAKRKSPTALTMEFFRKRGSECGVVERWIKMPKAFGGGVRKDFFGGDLIALTVVDTILVQAGVTSDHSGKVRHAINLPEVAQWLTSPTRKFWVMTWSKKLVGKRGRWVPRVSIIQPSPNGLEALPFQLA